MDADTSDILADYVCRIRQIKSEAGAASNPITGAQFDDYVLKRFFRAQLESDAAIADTNTTSPKTAPPTFHQRGWLRIIIALVILVTAIGIAFAHPSAAAWRQHIASLFMMHIQTSIHPLMSLWRTLTLPLLAAFPSLGRLYDESCLVANPAFHIVDMDCRPCANVRSVLVVNGDGDEDDDEAVNDDDAANVGDDANNQNSCYRIDENNKAQRNRRILDEPRPLMFRDRQHKSDVTVEQLFDLYRSHSDVYRNEAFAVHSSTTANGNVAGNLDEMFAAFGLGDAAAETLITNASQSLHSLWRLNRMNAVRLLRTVIRRPKRLPRTGMHIERYVAVDSAAAPTYRLPDMECARVFVAQLAGGRTIVLRPSAECADECRTVSVRLLAGNVCE